MEAVFFDAFGDEFGDAGFEKRDFALLESGDAARICVHTGDVHAEFREAGTGD